MSRVGVPSGSDGGGCGGDNRLSRRGYDFSQSGKVAQNVTDMRFNFGLRNSRSVSVDQTLATLFDTLSVECRWGGFLEVFILA